MFKKRKSLKDRLKNVADDLTADVFGYEKKVTKNVIDFLSKIEQTEHVLLDNLFVAMKLKGPQIKVRLYHQTQLLRPVSIQELVVFFAGEDAFHLGMEKKIVSPVGDFMRELALKHGITEEMLQVVLFVRDDQLIVKVYEGINYLQHLTIKELVKQFK